MDTTNTKATSFADSLRTEDDSEYLESLTSGVAGVSEKKKRVSQSGGNKPGASSKAVAFREVDIAKLDAPVEKEAKKVQVTAYIDPTLYDQFKKHRESKGWKSDSALLEHIIGQYYGSLK